MSQILVYLFKKPKEPILGPIKWIYRANNDRKWPLQVSQFNQPDKEPDEPLKYDGKNQVLEVYYKWSYSDDSHWFEN